ncbi:MAG: rod shape-determining protein MreC [Deltaproteobacteria bacterium]|nr:rod shape-determining protein MreC [Deltaproteobacteria bacterium]
MAAQKHRFVLPIVFAVLFILPLGSLYFHGKEIHRHSLAAQALSGLAAPGQALVSRAIDGLLSVWYGYIYLVEVEQQNEELDAERRRLLDMVRRCQDALTENARLQRLLDFREAHEDLQFLTARVIARDTSPYFRVLRVVLDRGTEDGVRVGMPVVSHQGVVGKVERITGRYCDVLLLTDARSRLSAVVAGKEVSGTVAGQGDGLSYTLTFQFPFQQTDLAADDLLVTTGHEQIFPKGLDVGRLASGTVQPTGRHQEVTVIPAVDLGHLEEVLIITNYRQQVLDPWKVEGQP